MSDSLIDRLDRYGAIGRGQGGPFLDAERIADLLDLQPARLAAAMSVAYKSVGSWDDFDDTVLAFAEATLKEYRQP